METISTTFAVSHLSFLKFLKRFHKKINPQKSSKTFDLPNLKNPGLDAWPRIATHRKSFRGSQPTPSYSHKSRLHCKEMVLPLDLASLKTVQICPLFLKIDYTMVFYGLRSTKPKKFETKKASTHYHAPPATSAFTSSYSHADNSHLYAPRPLYAYTCLLRMTSRMTSSSTTPVWPGPTWKSNPVQTACKK